MSKGDGTKMATAIVLIYTGYILRFYMHSMFLDAYLPAHDKQS